MEIAETTSSLGYAKPPWLFKGSALYHLHLVRAETAQAFIPKDFRLVKAFGYTLGGFFLVHYHDSPAGMFDELVVIAGIVWNPPTSCTWVAWLLVNNYEACEISVISTFETLNRLQNLIFFVTGYNVPVESSAESDSQRALWNSQRGQEVKAMVFSTGLVSVLASVVQRIV